MSPNKDVQLFVVIDLISQFPAWKPLAYLVACLIHRYSDAFAETMLGWQLLSMKYDSSFMRLSFRLCNTMRRCNTLICIQEWRA